MISFGRKGGGTEIDLAQSNGLRHTCLATQSLLLILVLANHCTAQNNPYRQSLFMCANSEGKSFFFVLLFEKVY